MLLIKIKQFLKLNRLVSFFELTRCFNVDHQVMREMLTLLIQKGYIKQKNKTSSCGIKCGKCHPFMTELYEWIG